jgi:alcohol dehydrogenase class IV
MPTTLAALAPLVIGRGSRAEAGPRAAALAGAGAGILFVADPGLMATPFIVDIEASLAGAGLKVATFTAFASDPAMQEADAAADLARSTGARAIVTLGGGSALDLAKAVAGIAPGKPGARHYQLCENPFPPGALPVIAIPTTSGTGSEATRTSILTRDDKAKVWLWDDMLKPALVLLDPEVSATLPPFLTAATGLDALVHAMEAATNRNASPANNLYAHEAIRIVMAHLETAVRNGGDLDAREGLARAAMLAGVAIDNAGTAVAHNIGHAMGSLTKIHHGAAVAIGMSATLRWNISSDDGRWMQVARAMGLERSEDIPAAFDALADAVGVPLRLKGENAGLDAAALARQMAQAENAAMRNSNFRAIADGDLAVFAAACFA